MIKKKVMSTVLAAMVIAESMVPAYAATSDFSVASISSPGNYQIEGILKSNIPSNVKAVYRHKSARSSYLGSLKITFSRVSKAVSYEVEIYKKLDSSSTGNTAASSCRMGTYKTKSNYFLANDDGSDVLLSCDTKTQIRVRAVFADGTYSDWSDTVHMTCVK